MNGSEISYFLKEIFQGPKNGTTCESFLELLKYIYKLKWTNVFAIRKKFVNKTIYLSTIEK